MKKILMVGVLAFAGMLLSGKAHAWQSCENVVVGMTPGGNGVAGAPIYQQQCVWLAGAVAIDPATRAFSSAWNYQNPDEALAYVIAQCGRQCVGQSFFEDFAYVAISEDDRAWGVSMVSAGDAVRQCQASGNPGCVAVLGASSSAAAVYWFYGAVAYDADTGASGSSWNQRRRSDAEAAAKQSCGSENCWAYVFQGGNGAIAKSKDGRLFGAWSESARGLIWSVSKEAKKSCKKATGDKDCEVVIKGPAAK